MPLSASWNTYGMTVAGWANGTYGSALTQLYHPYGLAITSNDILYIGDMDNHRIVVVDLNSPGENCIIGAGTGSALNQFNLPHAVFTTDTSLYVLDKNNHRIQKLLLNGSNATTVLIYDQSYEASYFFVDHDDNIYLSAMKKHEVLLYCANQSSGSTVAGSGGYGNSDKELDNPHGVFVDNAGSIYIADRSNHRIMKWAKNASAGQRVAGNGSIGNTSYQLHHPEYVVVDTNGYMYISDSLNNRIMRWPPNSTSGECIAGCQTTDGISPTEMNSSHSMAFDSNGSLYVTDWGHNRVQKFEIGRNHSRYSAHHTNLALFHNLYNLV